MSGHPVLYLTLANDVHISWFAGLPYCMNPSLLYEPFQHITKLAGTI